MQTKLGSLYLFSFIDGTSSNAVRYAVIASLTILPLNTLPPKPACVSLDLVVEQLDKLRLGVL